MATGDFLMVVPPGWIETPNADAFVMKYGEVQIADYINRGEWGSIDALLEQEGLVPAGQTTSDARFFNTGTGYRLWFKLIPIPGYEG